MLSFGVFSFIEPSKIILSVSISLIFDYHIMEYDTCSHNVANFDFILKQRRIFNNGKTSLQNSKSTLHIFLGSFLFFSK